MSTVTGPWRTVTGPSLALTISGSYGATLKVDSGGVRGMSQAGGFSLGCAYATVGAEIVTDMYEGGHLLKPWVVAGGEGYTYAPSSFGRWIEDPDYVYDPEHPEIVPDIVWTGADTIPVTWQISFSGLILKRRIVLTYPDRRQHMHPRDAHLEDAWFMSPDFVATASITGPEGSASESTGARRTWPEFEGLTDAEIPDAQLTPTIYLGLNAFGLGAIVGADGLTLQTLSVSGCNFDGVITTMANGGEFATCHVTGSGTTLTHTQDDPGPGVALGASVGVITSLPARWQWDVKFTKFDETDVADDLDPTVNAGFVRIIDTAGATEPVTYAASELPVFTPRMPILIGPSICDHRLPTAVGTIEHPGETFQVSIDPDWALDNGVYAAQEVDLTDTVPIIAQEDDLYCPIDAPDCAHGVGSVDGHRTPLYTLSFNEPSFYPLAADKAAPTADPNLRWQQTGELPSLRDMPANPLKWVFPPTLYSETAIPGGTISLAVQHRYYDRLNLLKTQDRVVDWRWPFHFKRRAAGAQDTVNDPAYGEDLHSAQQAGYLRFNLNKPRWAQITLTLTIDYSVVDVEDEHYTDGSDRTDAFDWSRAEASASYTIVVPAADTDFYEGTAAKQHEVTIVVDLSCPDDGSTPQLQLLDRLTISGLRLPLCTRSDTPEGFVEGGVVELFTDGTKGLKLSRDLGYDHTGRNTSAAPSAELSAIETWNFLADDWECSRLRNGAAMRCLRLPGEPWRHGIEEALGYIEPLQHGLDYTGDAGLLHYARPLTEFGIAGYNDVIQVSLDDDAYAAMGHAGYMYWLATRKRLQAASGSPGDTLVLDAAIRVATWKLAPGIQSVLTIRKALWGCAEILLKAPGGRRRLTPDYLTETGLTPQYVIYHRTAYQDADGATIADPGGSLPASGTWSHYLDGTIATRLDHHGVWRTPPLPPSKVRFRDPSRPTDPAATHTDVRLTSYLAQVWKSGRWSLYNLNDPTSAAAAKLDADYLGEIDLGANTGKRLWQSVDGGLISTLILGGNLVRLRCGSHAITRGGAVHTRLGSGAPWRSRRGTSSPSPMLLWVSDTDNLALLDGANARQSRKHGRVWVNGLPAGVKAVASTWHEAGQLTAALLDPADKLPLGAGAKLVEGGDVEVFVVSTKAAGGTATPTTVATLTAAQVAGDTVWPWLQRLAGGGWMVGCLAGGRYHEWRASDPGGTIWSEHGDGAEVDDAAGVSYCAHWRGRDGAEALSAYHGTAREVRVWWRPGPDGVWRGPCFTHAADPTMPYIYIRRDGRVECGWLVGTTWTRYRADHPESTWETW